MTNSQLDWVRRELGGIGMPYWIDSGTLLGLKRDGRLLPGDNDIDLGVWYDDRSAVLERVPDWSASGYKCQVYYRAGQPFKLKLYPASRGGLRMDINFYTVDGEHAICPQQIQDSWVESGSALRRAIGAGLISRKAMTIILEQASRLYMGLRRPRRLDIDRFPLTAFTEVWFWRVPVHFFASLAVDDSSQLAHPQAWEDYLEFRYGEWKVPNSDWQFHRDDGGIYRPKNVS